MKKYERHKVSGLDEFGDIPSDWELTRLKFVATQIKTGTTPPSEEVKYYSPEEVDWYGPSDFTDLNLTQAKRKISAAAIHEGKCRLHTESSVLLIGIGATVGKVAYAKAPFACNQQINVITLDEKRLFPKFGLFYLSTLRNFIERKASFATLPIFNQTQTKELVLLIPPLVDQVVIVEYLERKTAQIDQLIRDKEKLIELLHEERNAVINHAVTKGLNPDVPMKDSGIEWLGSVPEHWQIKRLKFIKSAEKNSFVDGPFGSNLKTEHFLENGDVFVIDSGFITSGEFRIHRDLKMITQGHFETVRRSECKADDIIISKIGANFGMSGILPTLNKPALVSGNTLKLTVDRVNYCLELIHFQLLNLKQVGEIDLLVKGSAQPALSMGAMNNLPFPLPINIGEQQEIVNFIKYQLERTRLTILRVEQEIQLLKEYKTALISEVVTGKVDVRDEVIEGTQASLVSS